MNPGNPSEPQAPESSAAPPNPPPDNPVTAYCRACGKGLTQGEVRTYKGTIYCAAHEPAESSAKPDSPWTAPPTTAPGAASGSTSVGTSPGLAFLLGLIPGVGAIYNGQYAKGFMHVVITWLLFLADAHTGLDGLFKLMAVIWPVYMAFEAYHTARRRQLGEAVDEFSAIFPLRHQAGMPVLPVLLIGTGIVFLLNNLDVIHIRQLMPYLGPCLLIGLGLYMLVMRLKDDTGNSTRTEVPHER